MPDVRQRLNPCANTAKPHDCFYSYAGTCLAIATATRRSSVARQARSSGRLLSSRDLADRDASYRRNSGMFRPER